MELKQILEAILFSAQKPLSARELRDILTSAADHSEDHPEIEEFRKLKDSAINTALEGLLAEHEREERSYSLVCVAGAWQFVTRPEYAPWIKALVGQKSRPPRLSQPALETLAIIAYRQPITRAEMEQVRGVSVDGVLQTLIERELIEQVGRAEVVGRPMTYGTTSLFLEYFGLRSLEDLPAGDELRRITVERPPALLTTEDGLATVPPEQLTLTEASSQTAAEPAAQPAPAAPADHSASTKPGSESA